MGTCRFKQGCGGGVVGWDLKQVWYGSWGGGGSQRKIEKWWGVRTPRSSLSLYWLAII